jgi:peroxiredoxin
VHAGFRGCRGVLGAAASVLALAACGGGAAHGPQVGAPLPDYRVVSLSGDSVSVAQMRGKVLLLNLWATWCVPCRRETPYLESVFRSHRARGLEVLGVSLDTGDPREVADFAKELGVTYTIARDPEMKGMDLYQPLGLPASFLVDRQGVLRWMRYGPIAENDHEFLDALETLLQ